METFENNIVTKVGIDQNNGRLLLPQCLQKSSAAEMSICRENVNPFPYKGLLIHRLISKYAAEDFENLLGTLELNN